MADLYGGQKAIPKASEARSGAAASADLILAHASRARWMAEYTFGVALDGVAPVAPVPAHSTAPGHTHSGGIDGTPITREMWGADYGMPDASLTSAGINNARAPAATLLSTALSGEKAFVMHPCILASIKPPGCPKDSTAHRRAKMILSIYASHAATLYVQVQNAALYSKVLNAAAFQDLELDDDVLLIPGEYNDIPFSAWIQGTTSGATWVVTLCGWSINQYQTTP